MPSVFDRFVERGVCLARLGHLVERGVDIALVHEGVRLKQTDHLRGVCAQEHQREQRNYHAKHRGNHGTALYLRLHHLGTAVLAVIAALFARLLLAKAAKRSVILKVFFFLFGSLVLFERLQVFFI